MKRSVLLCKARKQLENPLALDGQIYHQSALPLDGSDWHPPSPTTATERGAVFTRREVVEFMLDLTGYTANRPLPQMRLLEPSVGHGDFLLPAIDRLLSAWCSAPHHMRDSAILKPAIRGVELHHETFKAVRQNVIDHLIGHGLPRQGAVELADVWLIQGDFLLTDLGTRFHVVIGNPPYVRQELISDVLLTQYRARFKTIYDRADLYIPFIEKSLNLLEQGGHLGFICADRWMKNRYGSPLRQLIAKHYHLKTYVDMVDTPAFQMEVMAYPAITIITRDKGTVTRIAHRPEIDAGVLSQLATRLLAEEAPETGEVWSLEGVTAGAEPWILGSGDQLALVRRLEAHFPTLQDAGCKIGIGVATGADKAFIAPFDEFDVEPDRKLPLVTTRDIQSGNVAWRGLGVVNPFVDNGGFVCLDDYPRLKRYLEARKSAIAGRHVARKAPAHWYRTIDRIYPDLARTPKLLIPDIKGEAHIVYEPGQFYPHHNLYYITSDVWNLQALQAVLRSGIARLFVSVYSTRMRGGYLRFQAQYLRRIRVPYWQQVPDDVKQELITAAQHDDRDACNRAVYKLYGLSDAEREALGGNGAE
jgi:hypothetical protein